MGTAVGRGQIGPCISLIQGLSFLLSLWTTLTALWGVVPDRASERSYFLGSGVHEPPEPRGLWVSVAVPKPDPPGQ